MSPVAMAPPKSKDPATSQKTQQQTTGRSGTTTSVAKIVFDLLAESMGSLPGIGHQTLRANVLTPRSLRLVSSPTNMFCCDAERSLGEAFSQSAQRQDYHM